MRRKKGRMRRKKESADVEKERADVVEKAAAELREKLARLESENNRKYKESGENRTGKRYTKKRRHMSPFCIGKHKILLRYL